MALLLRSDVRDHQQRVSDDALLMAKHAIASIDSFGGTF
jgi:hypothetical protein